MIHLVERENLLDYLPEKCCDNNGDLILAYHRGPCLFVFNFNPAKSFTDYEITCKKGRYSICLDSDSPKYNGFGNIDETTEYCTTTRAGLPRVKLYLPSRSALVLKNVDSK